MATVNVKITGSNESAIKAFLETAGAADISADAISKSSNKLSGAVDKSTSTSGFSLKSFGESLFGMVPIWGKVGIAAGIVVASVVTGAIVLAARYQDATDKMAAQAGITESAAKKIGAAFLTTGGQTIFSAQQMMEAYGPVSGQLGLLAGHALTASQALGFMNAASTLAEATGQSLGSTTAALAKIMQTYGIPVGQAASATDKLFNTSRLLNVPVSTLAQTLDTLKTKLGPLAPSLSDTSALLVDLSTHGVTGSRGLLAVSTGMSTLLGGSKATNKEIGDLGLHLYDANGKFVGMASVIAQLSPKLAGMTQAQQALAEKALFGSTAGRELNATLLAGVPAWNTATTAANKAGTAHNAAAVATSGLGASFQKIKGAIADAGVTLGQYFLPIGATLMKWLASAAQWLAYILPGALKIMGVAFDVIGKVIGAWVTIVSTEIGIVINVIKTIVGVVQNVVNAVKGPIGDIAGFFQTAFGAISGIISGIASGVTDAVKGIIDTVIGVINFFIGAIDDAIGGINDALGVIPTFGMGKIAIPKIPKIPVLDSGGIVTTPTLALLAANSRPEAVVPLDMAKMSGGAGGATYYITMNVVSNDGTAVVNALKRYAQANGTVPITVSKARVVGA